MSGLKNSYHNLYINLVQNNFNDNQSIDVEKLKAIIRTWLWPIYGVLMGLLVVFVIFKIIILAKDLAASADDPQRRSEVKKAFLYAIAAPLVASFLITIISVISDTTFLMPSPN